MYIGIDAGTSGIKLLLLDHDQRVIASRTEKLEAQSPHRGWSEQDPEAWWQALCRILDDLKRERPEDLKKVRGLGLSGQQHGAVLLDASNQVLRPCILWNDTRAQAECEIFEERFPEARLVTGNRAAAGFTAPKLIWVRNHEPDVFRQVRKVLLPKAWLRFKLCGEMFEDLSDASGTLWLDVRHRKWSPEALAACGLSLDAMPRLVEGSDPTCCLKTSLVTRWGMRDAVMLAGGAGDNAAAAIGLGAIQNGDSFISLGTSGVIWRTTRDFRPETSRGLHAFCHAIPDRWHQMGVTLSAASSLRWWAEVTGLSEAQLLDEVPRRITRPARPIFLPYLSGERTPHSDDLIRGSFLGVDRAVKRAEMTQSVLEGVAFSLRDAACGLGIEKGEVTRAMVVGGGSKSHIWVSIIASVMNMTLSCLKDGDYGGAFGAARLARLAVGDGGITDICTKPDVAHQYVSDPALRQLYDEKFALYQQSYPLLRKWAEMEHHLTK
ncbi:xylulokinase [Candidatus Kirkpatrickella diaphorinae]|uniref:Xylulose kinase n=1 Tax=Candidatus Kirkpatrickella diaphorinae TaxID=2984322 RepID=A0ABY6GI60_9PROT|nr:xylulokinase [Candidatus Kirkpatrickella diaphorinae]UYH51198.1 xylulokinase [Candidatus Kirkpatrickella diaphorinae]